MAATMIMNNLSQMSSSSEEEKMTEHTARLSANAKPFHPYCFYEPVSVAIYNEGIPSMALNSQKSVSQILRGIQDEALDEFPPDAQEAWELEAVEIFVEMMAQLSMLEELEERSRTDFSHIKKRWEARRKEGLKTRPRAPKHMVDRSFHKTQTNTLYSSQCRSVVPYSHHHNREKMLHHETARRGSETTKKMPMSGPVMQRPMIQQPRKQS
jgi:hypothetical protein